MTRYRKRPVIIDAFRLPDLHESPDAFLAWADRMDFDTYTSERDGALAICTLEGTMLAEPGDWVVKGVAGEFYPVKDPIFQATYDPVEEP